MDQQLTVDIKRNNLKFAFEHFNTSSKETKKTVLMSVLKIIFKKTRSLLV